MGNIYSDFFSIPEEASGIGPGLRTPLTDIVAPLIHHDMGRCTSFESNYTNCLEAYGERKGLKACKFYFQDYMECAEHKKQLYRLNAMMNERRKQYYKGQLGLGPKVPRYADPPPMDSYGPNAWNNE